MIAVVALSSILATAATPAQTPTPDPCAGLLAELNRPTVGYSPCAAERGTVVAELGYQNTQIGPSRSRTTQIQIAQGFIRYGVTPRFELDLVGPNDVLQRNAVGSTAGFTDTGIGFKYELPPASRWEIGFDGLYSTPNGARTLTAGNATYTANADVSYNLTPATSIGSTLSFAATGGSSAAGVHAKYGTFTPSLLVLQQIDVATQAYVEYVDVSRLAPDAGNRAFMDVGIQRLLGDRLELDVEYGHALTGDPTLRFNYVGAGFGLLLGKP
ncbi:MAG: transporter family protein [Candidatus Tyrphobacter sp.]